MLRRLLLASVPVLLLGSACGGAKVIVSRPQALDQPTPQQQIAKTADSGGFAFIAQPHFQYIFAPQDVIQGHVDPPPTDVQTGTKELGGMVQTDDRLELTMLPSTKGTVALAFIETSTTTEKWGGVMIPEERKLFGRFASDVSLGDWLIVLDDVVVSDGRDPVPLTAYRWPRAAVETYAACGIPAQFVINDCTHSFYGASKIMYVVSGASTGVGQ